MGKIIKPVTFLEDLWLELITYTLNNKTSSFIEKAIQWGIENKIRVPESVSLYIKPSKREKFKQEFPTKSTTIYVEEETFVNLVNEYGEHRRFYNDIYMFLVYCFIREHHNPNYFHNYFNLSYIKEHYCFKEEDFERAYGRVSKLIGKKPSKRDYNQLRDETEPPLYLFVKKGTYFTKNNELRKEDPNSELNNEQNGEKFQLFQQAIERISSMIGHIPTTREYTKHKLPNEPSIATIYYQFNSYKNAIEAYNLNRNTSK